MSRQNASPVPQMGGWMSDNQPDTLSSLQAPPNQLKPSELDIPVSTSGKVFGCLQGFLLTPSDEKTTGQIEPPIEQRRVAYATDITLLPECLRRGASVGIFPRKNPQQKSGGTFESSVEWSKGFSYPLLCSLQQVII
jgi:hypothetical protein